MQLVIDAAGAACGRCDEPLVVSGICACSKACARRNCCWEFDWNDGAIGVVDECNGCGINLIDDFEFTVEKLPAVGSPPYTLLSHALEQMTCEIPLLTPSPAPLHKFRIVRSLSQNVHIATLGGNYVIKRTSSAFELTRQLRHAHVVTVLATFAPHAHAVLIEYAPLGDMYEFLRGRRGIRLSEEVVWEYASQLVSALVYLHSLGVVHRDVKTKNILLFNGYRTLKLADFGVSTLISDTHDPLLTTCVGTPYYLSPEILQNAPYTSSVDIWSFGCVLYELMTFTHPFVGDSLSELIARITSAHTAPREPVGFSRELVLVVRQCLRKSVAERFASFKEIELWIALFRGIGGVADKAHVPRDLAAKEAYAALEKFKDMFCASFPFAEAFRREYMAARVAVAGGKPPSTIAERLGKIHPNPERS